MLLIYLVKLYLTVFYSVTNSKKQGEELKKNKVNLKMIFIHLSV